jgi:hypothetical protein
MGLWDRQEPTGREKRRVYIAAFVIAFGIDLVISSLRGTSYQPSLLGLAIMIGSVVYFAWSWLRDR